MDYDTVCYPCLRQEVLGSFGETMCSLVDASGEIVAYWVEREVGSDWVDDCNHSLDENGNSPVPFDGKKVDQLSVYVGNLDLGVRKEELVQCFAVVGEILRVTLIRSRKTEVKTGSAFIKFAEPGSASRARFLDGVNLRGKKIKVMEKLVNDEDQDSKKDPEFDELSVYIGNVDKRITSLDLAEFLQNTGVIKKLTVLKNKDTGEHKGAAYVQFRDQEGLERALRLNGSAIAGKCLKISRKRKTVNAGEDETPSTKKARMGDSFDDEKDSQVYDTSSIYVGNLDPTTDKGDLEEQFKNTGDIVRVSILKGNRAAYIEFKDSWSVEGALCLNGSRLKDKIITVERKLLK